MSAPEQGRADRGTPTGQGDAKSARPGGAAPAARRPESARNRNRLGWIAVTVAGLLTAWRIIYAITAPSVANVDVYESVDLLLTLVLAVGAIVLGIVALGQRVSPRWPAVAALAVGTYAFVLGVASWIGRLMY
ncbi:hypothetical protein FE251_10210 [Georgenia wutianyii]|uniref:Uncharacterized protein n=1 Tax=Georgenia wutianyii TaxID=2585135 RepID=A0ABX5VPW2_9MICO|nr:hypothetical protein [Georgenia wutianyii]QDB79706.1 hypothetical protein FE251_10210 [Georgenia wutianyii]